MACSRPIAVLCLCSAFVAVPRVGLCQQLEASAEVVSADRQAVRDGASRRVSTTKREMPDLSELFKPLPNDFRRLVTRGNLSMLQAGALGALTFSPWDRRIQNSTWGEGTIQRALQPGALVGGFVFQSSAAIATYAVGRATKQTRIAELGADLVRAQIVSQTVTQAVKFSAQRTRPDGTSLSFPSGHTSSSFATASVLHAHFGLKAAIPAYAMATWVAASRVQMKRHHVSDVIVGASVGLLAGRSVTFGRGASRFALSPMVVPGGGGISLVKK